MSVAALPDRSALRRGSRRTSEERATYGPRCPTPTTRWSTSSSAGRPRTRTTLALALARRRGQRRRGADDVADLALGPAGRRARCSTARRRARATASSSCSRACPRGTRRCSGASASARSPMPGPNHADAEGHRLPHRSAGRGRRDHRRERARRRSTRSTSLPTPAPAHRLGRRRPRRLGRLRRAARRAGDGETPPTPPAATIRCSSSSRAARSRYPKMVLHTQASYGLGHVDHGALLARPASRRSALDGVRHRAGRRPRGAGSSDSGTSARRSCRSRSASRTPTRSSRSSRRTASRRSARRRRSTGCSCRPTSQARPVEPAPLHERRRAAQPGGHPGLGRGHRRPDRLRRLRADRDDGARRELPRRGRAARARWASRARATTSTSSTTTGDRAARRRGRQHRGRAPTGAARRALPGVLRRPARPTPVVPRRLVLHGRQGVARRRRLPVVRGPRRRRHHVVGVPHRSVRGGVGAGRAPGRRRGGGRRQGRPRAHADRHGVRASWRRATRHRTSWRSELQEHVKRSRRRTSTRARSTSWTELPEDGQRQDPPLASCASSCAGRAASRCVGGSAGPRVGGAQNSITEGKESSVADEASAAPPAPRAPTSVLPRRGGKTDVGRPPPAPGRRGRSCPLLRGKPTLGAHRPRPAPQPSVGGVRCAEQHHRGEADPGRLNRSARSPPSARGVSYPRRVLSCVVLPARSSTVVDASMRHQSTTLGPAARPGAAGLLPPVMSVPALGAPPQENTPRNLSSSTGPRAPARTAAWRSPSPGRPERPSRRRPPAGAPSWPAGAASSP